jgi:sodium/bile acid cotransporter 7
MYVSHPTPTGSVLYGLVTILLITPLLAPIAAALPLPTTPSPLGLGLAIFLCGPTTLSSGIALTQVVGGNVAMALLLTISSNLLAVFTLPIVLPLMLGSQLTAMGGITIEPLHLLVQLSSCVLAPALLGASLRSLIPALASFVDSNKKGMARLSAVLLSTVPWMQVGVRD